MKTCGGREQGKWFNEVAEWNIGNRKRARFWLDTWTGDRPLAEKFPRLFSMSEQQNGVISDVIVRINKGWE